METTARPLYDAFALNLRLHRESLCYTQTALGNLLEINPRCIGSYEEARCMPSADKLLCIARFFGLTLDELLMEYPSEREARRRIALPSLFIVA